MESKAQTAKAKAEAKFKMVGTKLNKEHLANFEDIMKKRGFKTSSSYIRHLIDFDAMESIEEERKQNEIMTNTIEVLRTRVKELEKIEESMNIENNHLLKYIATKIKKAEQEEEEEEKRAKMSLFERLKAKLGL